MRLLPQLPKSTVCLQCGDRGFPEILVACATCRLYAVHRYCLHKFPTNITDPVTWFCEDCRPGDYALLSAARMAGTRETVEDMSEEVLSSEGKETTGGDQAENRSALVPYTGDRPEKTLVPKREVTSGDRSEKMLALVPEKMLALQRKETTEDQSDNRLAKMLVPKREETAGNRSEKMLAPKREETTGDRSEKMLAPKREDITGDRSKKRLAPKREDSTGELSEKRLAIEPCTRYQSAAAGRLLDNAVGKGRTQFKHETATNDNDVILPEQKAVTHETTDDFSDKKLAAERQEKAGDLIEKKQALVSAASSQQGDAVRRGGTRETVTNDDDSLPEKKRVVKETAGNDNNVLPSKKTVTRETTDDRSNKKPILKREATTEGRSGKKLPLVPRPTAASLKEKVTVIQETAGNDKNVLPSRKTVTHETTDDRSNEKPIPEREDSTDDRSGKKLPLVPRRTAASPPVVDDALRSGKRCTHETTTKHKDDSSNKGAISIGRKRLRPKTTTDDNDVLLLAQKAGTQETTDDLSDKKPTPRLEGTTGGRSEKMLALVPEATAVCRPLEDAIWRGSLNIVNKGPGGALVGGFILFLSDTACDQVREEAEALASVWSIRLEMVPRRGLWPERFGKLGPARSEIGLFLLANAGEGDAEGLVREMVRQDFAMRGAAWRTEEAELLLFTSAVLPADLWMIDEKFYLWGVFRGRRESTAATVREARSSCLLRPTPSGRDDWIGIPFPLK